VREEEVGAEESEFRLALSGGKVPKDCWKQLFEELVVMHGPRNPETEAAHPE
jgi:6-phosphogluconolactonase/glucosamine-6-phosphate isomerase/deaminase